MSNHEILPVTLLGQDAILRESAKLVPQGADMRALAQQMRESMHANDGIGLAAPQVGKSLRMFVVDTKLFDPEEQKLLTTDVFLNPTLKRRGFKRVTFEEGCLSIPGVFGTTHPLKRVTLEAYTLEWEKVAIQAEDLLAYVFQHETNHLEGVLYIDHADPKSLHKVEGEEVRRWSVDEIEAQ